MTTLEQAARQALEALESSRVFVTTREKIKHPEGTEAYDEIIESLRQALEQKQEPVRDPLTDEQAQETGVKQMRERIQELEERCDELAADKGTYFRLYEALCIKAESAKKANKQVVTDLYTEQPKRRPLTEEQIEAISKAIERSDFFDCVVPFARAIEQAHEASKVLRAELERACSGRPNA